MKESDPIRILSVAQFRPEKDHPLMLQAMYELRNLLVKNEALWNKVMGNYGFLLNYFTVDYLSAEKFIESFCLYLHDLTCIGLNCLPMCVPNIPC